MPHCCFDIVTEAVARKWCLRPRLYFTRICKMQVKAPLHRHSYPLKYIMFSNICNLQWNLLGFQLTNQHKVVHILSVRKILNVSQSFTNKWACFLKFLLSPPQLALKPHFVSITTLLFLVMSLPAWQIWTVFCPFFSVKKIK